MKIDLTKYVLNKDGLTTKMIKPKAVPQDDGTVEYEGTDSVFFTIGKAFEASLLSKNTLIDEPTKEEILKRFALFEKINLKEEVELTTEEVDYIISLLINMYDIYFAGSIITYLNSLN